MPGSRSRPERRDEAASGGGGGAAARTTPCCSCPLALPPPREQAGGAHEAQRARDGVKRAVRVAVQVFGVRGLKRHVGQALPRRVRAPQLQEGRRQVGGHHVGLRQRGRQRGGRLAAGAGAGGVWMRAAAGCTRHACTPHATCCAGQRAGAHLAEATSRMRAALPCSSGTRCAAKRGYRPCVRCMSITYSASARDGEVRRHVASASGGLDLRREHGPRRRPAPSHLGAAAVQVCTMRSFIAAHSFCCCCSLAAAAACKEGQ